MSNLFIEAVFLKLYSRNNAKIDSRLAYAKNFKFGMEVSVP